MSLFDRLIGILKVVSQILLVIYAIAAIVTSTKSAYGCTYEEALNSDWAGYSYEDVVRILNEDMTEGSNLYPEQARMCLIGEMRDFYKEFNKLSTGIKFEALSAISALETGYFTSDAYKTHNNVGGLMGNSGYMSFNSVEEGIEALVDLLVEEYLDEDGMYYNGTTIIALSQNYNQSVHWVNLYVKVRLDMEQRAYSVPVSEPEPEEVEEPEPEQSNMEILTEYSPAKMWENGIFIGKSYKIPKIIGGQNDIEQRTGENS